MNRDLRAFLPAILASLLLAAVVAQTLDAFQRSGRWNPGRKHSSAANAADPFARLERMLNQPDQPPSLQGLRDPFAYGRAAAVAAPSPGPGVTRPAPDPAGSRPVLTAIVTDPQDPQAVIVYENRNYSVRVGDLFAEFRVVSISADGVVLDSGRERLVLQRPTKGR